MLETKTDLNQDTLDALDRLAKANLDSFSNAFELHKIVKDSQVQAWFERLAWVRFCNASELQQHMRANQGDPPGVGTFLGSARNLWKEVRTAISGGDAYVALKQVEAAEAQLKDLYEKTIKETAGSAMNDVLLEQFARVKAGYDQIARLRDERANHPG